MAPEVIDPGEKGYSFEVDIWSMGVIMYKLLTGKYPFYDDNQIGIYNKILYEDLIFPEKPYISDVAKDLIKQILVKDPKKRPGLNQILYHDFFHMNIFPKYPDIKFYTKEPSLDEKRKYIPDIDKDGRIYKEVELYKLIVNDIPEVKYEDIKKYELNKLNDFIELNENNKIENWITYIHESRFGFCYYQINNGMAGIMYKKDEENNYNGLHLIFNSENDIFYEINNNEGKINSYEVQKCPQNLKRKFDDFIRYHIKTKEAMNDINNKKNINENHKNSEKNMSSKSEETSSKSEDNSINNNIINSDISINNSKENKKKLVYIKDYIKDEKATIILLSDDIKQVIFNDKIQIFISEKIGKEFVGYVNREKKIKFLEFCNIMKNSNKDLVNRVGYIRSNSFKGYRDKLINKIKKDYNEHQNEEKDSIKEEDSSNN